MGQGDPQSIQGVPHFRVGCRTGLALRRRHDAVPRVEGDVQTLKKVLRIVPDADLHKRFPAQDGVGPTEIGRVPAVLALLDRPVKKRGLTSQVISFGHVVEPLRGLHQRDLGVSKIPKGLVKDLRRWKLVGIEDQDELALGLKERAVDIPRLGVPLVPGPVGRSDDVSRALGQRGLLQLPRIAVVKHIGVVRVANGDRGSNGFPNQLDGLVVAGDKDIHRRARHGRRRAAPDLQAPQHESEQPNTGEAIGLGGEQGERNRPVVPVD